MLNKIFIEDCMETMARMRPNSVDVILTSPPYNTERECKGEDRTEKSIKAMENYGVRYDVYESKTNDEYLDWTVELFNSFGKVLKPQGVVLYNISYGGDTHEQQSLMWRAVARIIEHTEFTAADRIIWKKNSALPNNVSPNKLTRICEDVFVFCRKSEYQTFFANKELSSVRDSGQNMYATMFNFITARNNDETCPLNKATFSSELGVQLLKMYAPQKEETVVYDPFMGTGTTAISALKYGIKYIGSELSPKQTEWAEERINRYNNVDQYRMF